MKIKPAARAAAIHNLCISMLVSTAAVTVSTPVYAQVVLEEIIVTARKRQESLQETPLAVSAFSADALEEAGLQDLSHLSRVVPNVDVQDGTGSTGAANIFIRGVGSRNTGANFDSGVGIYLDGVYLSRPDGALLDNVDIQSVQVLRGPQGALFGKNTTGGAVLYTTNTPSEEFEGTAAVRVGNFDRLDGKATLNLPLVDDLLYSRLSLYSTNRDGYFHNLVDGEDYTEISRQGGQLQLRYLPTDALVIDLNATYSEVDQLARGEKCIPATGIPGAGWQAALQDETIIIPSTGKSIQEHCQDSAALDKDKRLADLQPNIYEAETSGISATVDWEINDSLSFKSITAWRNTEAAQSEDLDALPIPLLARSNDGYDITEPRETSQFSQEFQLNGTAFDSKLDYVIGAFAFREETDRGIHVGISGPFFNVNSLPTWAFYLADATELITDNKAWAVFSQADWNVSDSWRLTLGLRYTSETRQLDRNTYVPDLDNISTGAPAVDLSGIALGLLSFPDGPESFNSSHGHIPSTQESGQKRGKLSNSDWSPMGSIQYIFEDLGAISSGAAYFRVASGFLSGGLSETLDLISGEIPEYDPEKVVNYELGLKFDAFDSTLRLNTALFYTDYTDRQLTSIRVNPDTGQIAASVINAEKASVLGLEIETLWIPVTNFEITLNAAFNNGDIQDYDDLRLVVPGSFDGCANVTPPGIDACPVDRSDEDLPRLPEESYYLAFQYTWETDIGAIIPRLQGFYRKEVNNCFDRSSCLIGTYEGDQYELSARLTWISPRSDWRVTLFSDNLTDKRYIYGGTPLVDVTETGGIQYNTPRTYGAEVAYTW